VLGGRAHWRNLVNTVIEPFTCGGGAACCQMSNFISSPSDGNRRKRNKIKLENGPMPNVMAALPNIGGTLCESSIIPLLVQRRKLG